MGLKVVEKGYLSHETKCAVKICASQLSPSHLVSRLPELVWHLRRAPGVTYLNFDMFRGLRLLDLMRCVPKFSEEG